MKDLDSYTSNPKKSGIMCPQTKGNKNRFEMNKERPEPNRLRAFCCFAVSARRCFIYRFRKQDYNEIVYSF